MGVGGLSGGRPFDKPCWFALDESHRLHNMLRPRSESLHGDGHFPVPRHGQTTLPRLVSFSGADDSGSHRHRQDVEKLATP